MGQNESDVESVSTVDAKFFEAEVRPLLSKYCFACHGTSKQEGGLRLDERKYLLTGGESGPAVLLEDPQASLLLEAIRYEDLQLPPVGQLEVEKIKIVEEWLARGAPWPSVASDSPMALRQQFEINDSDRDYWAFRPLNAPSVPHVSQPMMTAAGTVRTAVDLLVVEQLQAKGLAFAPDADRNTLMRRIYLDLIGVPPTQSEMAAFLSDSSEDAYERLVDRLLADPRYGEKWASQWLDLVRYAESDGFNQDADRPTAYIYRDWLIKSLNADLPYNAFVSAQIAGDEIAPDDPQMLAATGYLRHWIYEYNQRDARSQWSNILNDITDVTGEVFFGLGIGCARCHDHKFDPLLQADYFRLQASFAAFIPRDDLLFGTKTELVNYHQQRQVWEAATAEAREQLGLLESPLRKSTAESAYNKFPLDIRPILFKKPQERDGFEQQIAALADNQVELEWSKLDFPKQLPEDQHAAWSKWHSQLQQHEHLRPKPLPKILAAGQILGPPPAVHLPNHTGPDTEIVPATFEVFGAQTLDSAGDTTAEASHLGRRTQLAQWINAADNPLPHRVIVNRMWQALFGAGIVRNTNDFGRLGEPPTHPELLDWLACWFLEDGRSMKRLHRLLVTSSVYRQSSQADFDVAELGHELDEDNRLLWHFPARRMEAEQIRDAMLVATGSLLAKSSGVSEAHESRVRSVYTQVKRNKPHPLLVAFDTPDRSSSIGRRNRTTTVNQSLVLSNSQWTLDLAQNMATSLLQQSSSPQQHINDAYERAFARCPSDHELERAVHFLEQTVTQMISQRESTLTPEPTEAAQAQNAPTAAGEASADVAINETASTDPSNNLAAWHQQPEYSIALTDLCHVLLNASEFLYND